MGGKPLFARARETAQRVYATAKNELQPSATMLLPRAFSHRGPAQRQRSMPPILGANILRDNIFFQVDRFSSETKGDRCGEGGGVDKNRVPKTLYRQLLSWCRRYDGVPFINPLPPMTLSSPLQVNQKALKRLSSMRASLNDEMKSSSDENLDAMSRLGRKNSPGYFALYKEDVVVKENMITFPEIRDANELRAVIRSIYWINNQNTIANFEGIDAAKEEESRGTNDQLTLAFDAIKSCNQLSSRELDSKRNRRNLSIQVRERHSESSESKEFPTVKHHVGQVIRHRVKNWRGVVVGWTIQEDKSDGRPSSLTKKQYLIPNLESIKQDGDTVSNAKVQYTILADLNDAQSEITADVELEKYIALASQEDLSSVDDPCLQRIHNGLIKQYFTKFDASGHFVPNDNLTYMYPMDRFSPSKYGIQDSSVNVEKETGNCTPKSSPQLDNSRLAILNGVQKICCRLLPPLSGPNGQGQDTGQETLSLTSSLESAVQSMLTRNTSQQNPATVNLSLAKLYHFHLKLNTLLWARNTNRQHRACINFSLGQIVKHKLYGFRGVVMAWDPKPRMDVRNWDGLKYVETPEQKPFYHVHPDVNDCIHAFGGPRNFRYVCQDNLELSHHSAKPLELETDLDPAEWKWDGEGGRYIPSAEMKFMYAEDLEEHEMSSTETVRNLRKILTECMLEVRDGGNNGLFSMDDLFCQLQHGSETLEDAIVVQDYIKEIWKETPNPDLRNKLETGITRLMEGKYEIAQGIFSEIVASDPMYAEAHNKKATVHYMMGEKDNSIKAAEEALKIDCHNFQALAGIGLIEMDSSHYDKATEYFRKCLAIHPWLVTVSSKLFRCMFKKENGAKKWRTPWQWSGPV